MLNYTMQGQNYEIYLAQQNRQSKKEQGQYYTPRDIAVVMSKWFKKLDGENICDVSCGTGNLILTYLEIIGKEKTTEIIKNKQVFLYDIDKQALDICKNTILEIYGNDLKNYLNIFCCDFLDKNIKLPENCKVISNPPYAKIKEIKQNWNKTNIIEDTMEYYSAFIEKIINQSKSSVIISPYSFLSGNKFYSLRKELNKHNGFFVSFDNVPANIFGKKYNVFNSNKSNSVRATISVIENKQNIKGFRTTPLIRFKNEERNKLLNCEVLENQLGNEYQVITDKTELTKMYCKCEKSLGNVWKIWKEKAINNSKI